MLLDVLAATIEETEKLHDVCTDLVFAHIVKCAEKLYSSHAYGERERERYRERKRETERER